MTRREVMTAIAESEKAGVFDVHVDPIPEELVIPGHGELSLSR